MRYKILHEKQTHVIYLIGIPLIDYSLEVKIIRMIFFLLGNRKVLRTRYSKRNFFHTPA